LWSLGVTLLEVAQGRFPFPPPGYPPLSPIDLVQYLLETNIAALLEDVPDSKVKWSASFRHFLGRWYSPRLPVTNGQFRERVRKTAEPRTDLGASLGNGNGKTECRYGTMD
jgi:hypothetical protein